MLISGRNHSKIGIPFFETSVVAFLKGSVFTMVIKKLNWRPYAVTPVNCQIMINRKLLLPENPMLESPL